jgi:hypothetical protein
MPFDCGKVKRQARVAREVGRPVQLPVMKDRRDTPHNRFTSAQEAIGNLLFHGLDDIFSGGWTAALMAHSEIELLPVPEKAGAFYRNFLPLLKNVVLLLVDSYRRHFKLALAHPRQAGRDPNDWAWVQFQPALGAAVACIRDWYIMACDGSNQYMQPVGSAPFQPGRTVSVSIPLDPPEIASPESWRAPAWLFAVGPAVGIGPLKTKHVPATDSEERLSAAHTRLLLKGARRVFLWKLGAEIETVRNEEIASAGANPPVTIAMEQGKGSTGHKGSKHQRKGTEGLSKKVSDFSKYMDGLTEKQQLGFSLRLEYRLPLTEVASRMGIDRKTAYEHFLAASKKIDEARSNEKRNAKHAKDHPED